MRHSGRKNSDLRKIAFTNNYTKYAEGSVLAEYGDTKVLCNASIISGVPKFLKGKNQGWVTAEYSMLPRATHDRVSRDVSRGSISGRSMEIQRLIGRSLRSAVILTDLPEYTIAIDCDVIQADVGTRAASITGGCIALYHAVNSMKKNGLILPDKNPFNKLVASVSVGIYGGEFLLDLDYLEDANSQVDLNVVMNNDGNLIEVQGTAESKSFSKKELEQMLSLAELGITELFGKQKSCL